jgi:hypothetical protein
MKLPTGSLAGFAGSLGSPFSGLSERQATGNGTNTITELRTQWANPADVSTILMVIGGDVV